MAGGEPAQAVVQYPQGFGGFHPAGNHGVGFRLFAARIRFEIHVFAGIGKHGGEYVVGLDGHTEFHQSLNPMKIAEIAPLGVKVKTAFVDDFAADKNRAGQGVEPEPNALRMRRQSVPMADILAVAVGDDGAGQQHFHLGIRFQKIVNSF